jgi:hypothetical protein
MFGQGLDATAMNPLNVEYRQDPETSWWTATVAGKESVVTQGKTLLAAYASVRDALSLFRDDARSVLLRGKSVWDKRTDLAPEILAAVQLESDLRIKAIETGDELERATLDAIRLLVIQSHFSLRDTGQLLGITYQRVEQITKQLSERNRDIALGSDDFAEG